MPTIAAMASSSTGWALLILGVVGGGGCNAILGFEAGSLRASAGGAGGGGGTTTSTTTSPGGGGGAGAGGGEAGSAATGGAGGVAGAGGAGGTDPCPAAVLHDDFSASSLNTSLWVPVPNELAINTGPVLALIPPDPASGSAYGEIISQSAYDLTGCSMWVEAVRVLEPSKPGEIFFQAAADADNKIRIDVPEGNVTFHLYVGGAVVAEQSISFDSVQHRWWRIREAAGTLYWETSTNTQAWTVRMTHSPTPAFVSGVYMRLGAGVWTASTGHGHGEFDNANWIP